jgi:hypothetical protein
MGRCTSRLYDLTSMICFLSFPPCTTHGRTRSSLTTPLYLCVRHEHEPAGSPENKKIVGHNGRAQNSAVRPGVLHGIIICSVLCEQEQCVRGAWNNAQDVVCFLLWW